MANTSNLLKDAIADAKAVRATALANAKAALEEAFNQRFSAVFADKLREDSAIEAAQETAPATPVAENADKDKVGATKPSKSDGAKPWSKDNMSPDGKKDQKGITPNTVPAAKDGGDATKGWSKDNKGNAMDGTPNGIKETAETAEENTEEAVEETVTNEDLDEIIRELQAEAGDMPVDEPPAPDAGADVPAPDAGAEPPMDDPAAAESEPIKSGDTVVISKIAAPDAGAEAPPAEEPPAPEAPPVGGEEGPAMEEEDIDLNELLASLNEEAKEEDEKEEEMCETAKVEEEEVKVDETLKAENAELKSDLNEAIKTVEYLKTQINEINLLNAKLLYTNKLFKEYGMNRDQKVKVVEAFDLTKNVREVKMTYANWCESLNFGGKAQRKPQGQSNVTVVTEGLASKTVASTKPSKEVLTENVNVMADRFKKLAGIKSVK